jgi:hypothetical protein
MRGPAKARHEATRLGSEHDPVGRGHPQCGAKLGLGQGGGQDGLVRKAEWLKGAVVRGEVKRRERMSFNAVVSEGGIHVRITEGCVVDARLHSALNAIMVPKSSRAVNVRMGLKGRVKLRVDGKITARIVDAGSTAMQLKTDAVAALMEVGVPTRIVAAEKNELTNAINRSGV